MLHKQVTIKLGLAPFDMASNPGSAQLEWTNLSPGAPKLYVLVEGLNDLTDIEVAIVTKSITDGRIKLLAA